MENTFIKVVPATPKDGSVKNMPPTRASEQTEAVKSGFADVQNDDRLQMSTSVGKKGETKAVPATEIESLRPSEAEMKNG